MAFSSGLQITIKLSPFLGQLRKYLNGSALRRTSTPNRELIKADLTEPDGSSKTVRFVGGNLPVALRDRRVRRPRFPDWTADPGKKQERPGEICPLVGVASGA
jgi:hypothetical protein